MFNITFQQIESFLTIAKFKNLTNAAKFLFTSEPALSKTIKRFEDGIGMRLFIRSKQGMELTADGQSLFRALEPLYEAMDRSIKTIQLSSSSAQKQLRIIESNSFEYSEDFNLLKETIHAYQAQYPDIVLRESIYEFRELRQTFEFGNMDIVLTQDFVLRYIPNLSSKRVSIFRMYIALAANHPLAQSDELNYSALGGEVLYTIPTLNSELADIENLMGNCSLLGFKPKKIEFCPNFQTLLHVIKQGKGFSITGKYTNIGLDGEIKYFSVPKIRNAYIIAAWRTGRLTNDAKNFIDMLPELAE
jgi:DNA-binding transcriptional LysR family regulator